MVRFVEKRFVEKRFARCSRCYYTVLVPVDRPKDQPIICEVCRARGES